MDDYMKAGSILTKRLFYIYIYITKQRNQINQIGWRSSVCSKGRGLFQDLKYNCKSITGY